MELTADRLIKIHDRTKGLKLEPSIHSSLEFQELNENFSQDIFKK